MTLSNRDYYDNLNIYTKFGDLQPSQFFTLFHELRRLPEYSNCSFLPSLDTVLLKLTPKSDEFEGQTIKRSVGDDSKLDDDKTQKKTNLIM